MNNPNPFVPQGSVLERINKSRSQLKLAVFATVGISAVALTLLLMQGCKQPETPPTPPPDTNPPVVVPLFPEPTNPAPPAPTNPPAGMTPGPGSVVPVPGLVTPSPAPIPAADVPGTASVHTVEKGDSFYTLSKKFGVSVKAIEAANPGVDSRKLKLGQKLNIPAGAATPAPTSPAATTPGVATDTAETVYVVKSNDNLSKIAKSHGTTVNNLKALNKLTTDRITVGQKLKVPAKTVPASPAAPAPVTPAVEPMAPAPALPFTPPPAAPGTAPVR